MLTEERMTDEMPELNHDEELKLTEEEKQKIDAAVQTEIDTWNLFSRRTDQDDIKRAEARQLICSYGRGILPYIKPKFFESSDQSATFHYTQFASQLATEEDYQLTLDCLKDPKVVENSDYSAFHALGDVILRDVWEYVCLQADGDEGAREIANQRLEEIANQLIGLMPRVQTGREWGSVEALALTGTEAAWQYLTDNKSRFDEYTWERIEKYLSRNIDESMISHMTQREAFETPEEVRAGQIERERIRNAPVSDYNDDSWHNEGPYSHSFEEAAKDEDDRFDEVVDSSPHVGWRRIGADEPTKQQIFPAAEREIFSDVDARIEKIEALMETLDLEETVVPLARLHLYNFLVAHPEPNEEELTRELNRIQGFSKMEEEYQHQDNLLPTIGIELEVPKASLNSELTELLKKLGMKNYSEGSNLREVNPDFSYSPWVQGQIIQELAKLGALPLEKNEAGVETVGTAREQVLSMHVNLGIPEEIDNKTRVEQHHTFELANDPFIYAFSSSTRILARKTSTSWRFNDADESKKNKAKKAIVVGDEIVVKKAQRFEMRAGEFRDFPTFRMLAEVQRVMAAVFSYIKVAEGLPHSLKEERLADLAKSFLIDSQSLIHNYTGGITNLADLSDDQTAELIQDSNIQPDCRDLITKYSHEVARILNEQN